MGKRPRPVIPSDSEDAATDGGDDATTDGGGGGDDDAHSGESDAEPAAKRPRASSRQIDGLNEDNIVNGSRVRKPSLKALVLRE